MRAFCLILSLFIFFNVRGQLSSGGWPADIINTKSAYTPVAVMPSFHEPDRRLSIRAGGNEEIKLKPFRFAHAFPVDFTPGNSGAWYKTVTGMDCWKMEIYSSGAKSINLIFHQFKLPQGSKLFLYNAEMDHLLGAFTEKNNKESGKFAVSPVKGDRIFIHYEVPPSLKGEMPFKVARVNHDYVGILARNERRPLGKTAGECNVDINCDEGAEYKELKNSVCRMIVNGEEICTGTLVNNTMENQKPYILSAAHCYDKWEYAETTLYTFNYESPFCAPLDGDPGNSVSGAIMKAQFDSLDFALTELSVPPPPEFRPYYAGWDRSGELPESTISIHHPQGDIKKIAIDDDPPESSDFPSSSYTKNGFLKILRWDNGVTEVGSSGGPLFSSEQFLIGTLTGGVATCSNPVRDYFESFAKSWDYRPDSAKQLKYWLDPMKSNAVKLKSKQFNTGETLCAAYTNLNDLDDYSMVQLLESDRNEGYWGGSNNLGITEFVERFSILGNEQLEGVSLGVGKVFNDSPGPASEITIKVYDGSEEPEELIYKKTVAIDNLVDDAMNYIGFDSYVAPSDTFFVGFELSNMQPRDSFIMYQSLRPANTDNFFYFKQNGVWSDFESVNLGYNSMVGVFEVIACNIDDFEEDKPPLDDPFDILAYPNPSGGIVTIKAGSEFEKENVSLVNLLGKTMDSRVTKKGKYKAEIDLSGNVPGIYFIRFRMGEKYTSRKISYVPW